MSNAAKDFDDQSRMAYVERSSIHEEHRLSELKSLEIMDTEAERDFEEITALAARIFSAPISLISLLDDKRQWFKSKRGLEVSQTPRDLAFCAHAIQGDETFVVGNAMEDNRFRKNPLVTGYPHIRFYAGALLTTEQGAHVGTLCIIDQTPRKMTSEQMQILEGLARQVVHFFEARLVKRKLVAVGSRSNQNIVEPSLISTTKMASLGTMAAQMAHEINNPLTIILAKTELMRMSMEKGSIDAEKILENVDSIHKTVERIHRIITGLRNFSRNDAQDPFRPVSVAKILEDTSAVCTARLNGHSIQFKVKCQDTHRIECRPTQISQILLNLLNNSVDAINPHERKWIFIDVSERDGRIRIRLTDSGSGIPESVVKNMMNPFFTTKGVGQGTGLGLSISKAIAESHQGGLFYEPYFGHTSFVLELPAIL